MCDRCDPESESTQPESNDDVDNTQFSDFDDPSFNPTIGSAEEYVAKLVDTLRYYNDPDYDEAPAPLSV